MACSFCYRHCMSMACSMSYYRHCVLMFYYISILRADIPMRYADGLLWWYLVVSACIPGWWWFACTAWCTILWLLHSFVNVVENDTRIFLRCPPVQRCRVYGDRQTEIYMKRCRNRNTLNDTTHSFSLNQYELLGDVKLSYFVYQTRLNFFWDFMKFSYMSRTTTWSARAVCEVFGTTTQRARVLWCVPNINMKCSCRVWCVPNINIKCLCRAWCFINLITCTVWDMFMTIFEPVWCGGSW